MNKYNHFLTSFLVLFVLFFPRISLIEIIMFSYIFGVFLDKNQKIGKYLKKPEHHRRTWIEEPFGFLLIGIPAGILLSVIRPEYFLLTVIPYGIHIIQDYLTIHEVSPLAPFSSKPIKCGFFKAMPPASWYTGEETGISEKYVLFVNIALLVLILLHISQYPV